MKNNILRFILFLSISLSQNIWGNASVSTSDQLNALTFNPAGLAIDYGELEGLFIQPDSNGKFTRESILYTSSLSEGFGMQTSFNRLTKPLKINTYDSFQIGFGFNVFKNLNSGISYNNKTKLFKTGLLYRPLNELSLGLTGDFDNDNNFSSGTFGFAVRPLSTHKLTLGFDYTKNENTESYYKSFIEIHPLDGLKLSFSSTTKNNPDFNINLSFVLSPSVELFTSSISNDISEKTGIGFMSSSHIKPTLQTENIGSDINVLKVNLDGTFIEEPPKLSPFNFGFPSISFGLFDFQNDNKPGIQLRTWIEEMDTYTEDDNINAMVINLGTVNCGFSKRQEIRNALNRFKESGKKIYVYSENSLTNGTYYMISMADEIYMHEQNSVFLNGISSNFVFYKGLLDKYDVTPVVYKVNKEGKSYKGAMDQFLNTELSDEMAEEYNKIFDDLYYVFVRDISEGRGWDAIKTESIIDNGPYLIADKAVEAGLITSTMYPDEFKDYIKKIDDKKTAFVDFKPKKEESFSYAWKDEEKTNIAIIYAVGGIMSGESNPGPKGSSVMGDKTIIKAFKEANGNDEIDAIILRIDSGGGSAIASDMMWREMFKARQDSTKSNKPLIVSMSDVAASGGYYIATEADKIVANETTITGSIGVISFWPNFSKLMKNNGINFDDSIKRGKNADFKYISIANRMHNEYEQKKIQESLNNVYDIFKKRVINGRENLNDMDELDNIALGRIWTGSGAKNVFLADEVGGLKKALEVTKNMLEIPNTAPIKIHEYPKIYDNRIDISLGLNAKDNITLYDMVPDHLKEELDIIDKLPMLYSDDMLMIIPFELTFK
ncbi:MAG: hypothetical protein CMG00_07975 [Candidatus Marinimicrobia bacterium]|nr:hypothetical protein [Candidatus Neomarinimicrobiota bacterium]